MRAIFLTICLFCFLLSFGQQANDSIAVSNRGSEFDAAEVEASIKSRKLRFNLEFGTSFGGSRYGSYFGTYVAPHFTYPLNHRFSISAGGYFSGISPSGRAEGSTTFGYPYSNMYSRSLLYIEGAYRLNENLTVTGMAYKEINPFGQPAPYPGYNAESRGFIMGVHYKVSDHVFIRGEVEVSNGAYPFRSDPFMNPAGSRMTDPFFYGR